MKMRLTGFLAFALLSISILSYGISGAAFATSDPNPALPVSTDLEIAGNGAIVKLSGTIPDYNPSSGHAITLIIKSPDGNPAYLAQETPKSDGSFEIVITAGGPKWKLSGDYTMELKYGADKSEVSINYVGGEAVISTQEPPPVIEPEVVEPPPVVVPEVVEPPPVVVPEVVEPPPKPITCGEGTEPDANGICRVIQQPDCPDGFSYKDGVCVEDAGGCLIATATYGTELAPQVQLLREIRDNTLFSTSSGTSFMVGFNTLYYSFAPTISDWERENVMFKESVKLFITPMLSTLSIMSLADEGSEVEVLGFGISVIALNLGMYIAAPALIGFKVHQRIKSRK